MAQPLSLIYPIKTNNLQTNIKIIIADDHLLFIEGLRMLIESEPGITIIDIANDGKELLQILPANLPDVILLDINMPNMNGLNAAIYIRQSYPSVKILMLSTYSEEHLIEKAKKNGANGYLLKNSSKEELLQSIRLVYKGLLCFPFRVPERVNEFSSNDIFLKQYNFTKRETEVILLIKQGLTNQQISDKLFLSIYTVETHRKNIMQKLHLNSPSALMKFIITNNL